MLDSTTGELVACYVPTSYYQMPLQLIQHIAISRTPLPNLPTGYTWLGPFLRQDIEAPAVERGGFRFSEPLSSPGISLGHLINRRVDRSVAVSLAQKVLATRDKL